MNKIVSIKNTSAIFLATVLLAGIIALSSPSSFMVGAAQAVPQYGGMEREYDSYEQQTEYPSYPPDYKPEYPSDNSYKSKDSVSINKLNCNNVNIIGDVTGDISVGNNGKVGEGDSGSGNNNGDWGYGKDGYQQNKKDKDFACIINNNNNINGGEEPEPLTCEECFREFLTNDEFIRLVVLLAGVDVTLEQYCDLLGNGAIKEEVLRSGLSTFVIIGSTPEDERIDLIIECLIDAGIVFAPPQGGSGFNTQGERGSLASFGIHDGGTAGDLTATEKTTKLKQQWLELLP